MNAKRIWIVLALFTPLPWAQDSEAPTKKAPEAEPEANWRIEERDGAKGDG